MKFTIDIDCTPKEARAFLGLPDVEPMQASLMKQIEERLSQNLSMTDPESMMKTWLPMSVQGLEQIQKMFWQQMASATPGKSGGSTDSKG
ncbi:MAG: DUF6489 family protein [Magnetovibrionaceae bacterium]